MGSGFTLTKLLFPRCIRAINQILDIKSISRSVLQSLVLSWMDYGNATLAGIPLYLLKQFQSVTNSAARFVFSSWRFDHITPFLWQLHWLTATQRMQFKLTVLVYKCLYGMALSYLANELQCLADSEARRRLHSTSSSMLTARHIWLSTIGDLAFPVAAAGTGTWNSLSQHVTSTPSVSVFPGCLKAFLFRRSFLWTRYCNCCSACAVTVIIFGHINHSFTYSTYIIGDVLVMPFYPDSVHTS